MEERFLRSGAVQPEAEARAPHSRIEYLLKGLTRFAVFTVGAAALAAGLGLVAGWLTDGDLLRYLTLGLYVGGAILVGYAVLTFTSQPIRWVGELGEDLGTSAGGESAAFVAIGLTLIGIAVLIEWFAF